MRKLYLIAIWCLVVSVCPVCVFAANVSVPSEYKIGPLLKKEIIDSKASEQPEDRTKMVKVIVSLGNDYLNELPQDMRDELSLRVDNLGGHIGLHAYNNVQVWIPLDKVEELSRWSEVTFISAPILPGQNGGNSYPGEPSSRSNTSPQSDVRSQNIVTEGLSVIGADKWQQIGITGKGVNVAVIDWGFKGSYELLGKELPTTVEAYYFGDKDQADFFSDVHGTACAEIVHDIAPDASLALLDAGDIKVGFHKAVAWMLENNIDIASSSIGLSTKILCYFMYELIYGPEFSRNYYLYLIQQLSQMASQVEATVKYAVQNGDVTWAQAAGNDGRKKWSGWFVDSDHNGLLNFSPSENYNILDTHGTYGQPVYVLLMWGDNNTSTTDYDLGIFDENNNPVALSVIDQARVSVGVEACKFTPKPGTKYKIAIKKIRGADQNLDLYLGDNNLNVLKYFNNAGTVMLARPAPIPEAITVGAMEQENGKWDIAYYSSQGPGKDGILKPDVMGPSAVSTASYAPSVFHGTSAATPHIAGLCALQKQLYPNDSPAQQKEFLQNTAIDYGITGPDNVYGYGLAHLPTSVFYRPTIYFPNASSEPGNKNHIGIVNPSFWPLKLFGELKAFNYSGQELVSKPIFLPQGGRFESSVTDLFPGITGISYITLGYAGGIACGYMSEEASNSCCGYMVPAIDQSSKRDMFIPHIASNDIWKTQVELINTGVLEKNITLLFDNGVSRSFTLPPKHKKKFLIRDFFGGIPQPGIHSAKLLGTQGLVGTEVFSGGNYAGGISLEPNIQKDIFFPHVANDNQWWTGLVAYNPSFELVNLNILPFDAYGNTLPGKTVPLNGESKFIGTVDSLGLPTNTAWFKVESTGEVHSFELFGTADGKQMAGYSTTGIKALLGVFPRINRLNTWTGIAFVNPNPRAVTIVMAAYDDRGEMKALNTYNLKSYGKIVDTAENLLAHNNDNFDPIRMAEATHINFFAEFEIIGFQLEGTSDGMILESIPALAVK